MAAFTAIAIGLLIASAVAQAKAQHDAGEAEASAGSAQRRAAESQADLADYNAGVADLQAEDAEARGAEEESRFRMGVRGMIGSQRAGTAAGNIDVGYGSAVDVQADAAFLGELDALTIRTNAAREAWGYRVQGYDLRKRAEIARKEGVMLESAGEARASAANWQVAGTLLGTGASLAQARYGSVTGGRR